MLATEKTEKEKEAIAFIGDCIDRKLVLAILSFDVPRLIVLVKLRKILQSLE
jgi:hypothetical protein